MLNPSPIPLPVQPLAYESNVDNPWPHIVRAMAIAGIILGGARAFSLVGAVGLFSARGMPTQMYWWYIANSLTQLFAGITGLILLIACIQLFRRRNATGLAIGSAFAMLVVTIVGGLATGMLYASRFGPMGSLAANLPGAILYSASSLLGPVSAAAFPLFMVMVMRRFQQNPQYQAAFQR